MAEIGDFIKDDINSGIVKNVDSVEKKAVDHTGNVFDLDQMPTIIKYKKEDTEHSLVLKGLKAQMERCTFRTVGTMSTKAGFSGQPFFYGFTGKNEMLHLESITTNHPEIYPTVLYYQAGNYADLLLEDGNFEHGKIYDRQQSYPTGTCMMGIVQYNGDKPRFSKWVYAGTYPKCPLYLLYLLIMFSDSYYIFYGMTKAQIIELLEIRDMKIDVKNRHYYQAIALVCYYGEDVPDSYNLPGYKEKIMNQFKWILNLASNDALKSNSLA